MSLSMKLFVLLWLIMITRVTGAWMAGRQCLRLRHLTKSRRLYEWLTAFGVGLIIWSIADLGLIWNSIVNGPENRTLISVKMLWFSIGFNLLETLGVWLVTLVLINGSTPGFIRKGIFWALVKTGIMIYPTSETHPHLTESSDNLTGK